MLLPEPEPEPDPALLAADRAHRQAVLDSLGMIEFSGISEEPVLQPVERARD